MKYCTNCGSSVLENQKFCPECGCSLQQISSENVPVTDKSEDLNDLSTESTSESQAESISESQAESPITAKTTPVKTKRSRHAAMSIVAFILSFTLFLSPLAVVFAIIDMAKNKKSKHGLSIAALIIGGLLTLIFFLILIVPSGSDQVSESGLVSDNANYNANEPVDEDLESNDQPSSSTDGEGATETSSESENDISSDLDAKEIFISSCSIVDYQDVSRTPEDYEGLNVQIEGEVIQVLEGWLDSVTYRVATNSNGFDDVWLVTYVRSSDEARILEGDYVTCYGVCNGVESYTTVLDSQRTIPTLEAEYIDIATAFEAEYTTEVLVFDVSKEEYGDGYRYYGVVEIKNTGDGNLYIKDASFDLENTEGHLLQTDDFEVSVYRTIIEPGEVGYLYTSYEVDIKDSIDVNDLVLVPHFDAETTYVKLAKYDVSDVSISDETYGVNITGRVTNNTKEDEAFAFIKVILLDKDGNILSICDTVADEVKAGKTASFEMTGYLMKSDVSFDDISRYEVLAEESYYGF